MKDIKNRWRGCTRAPRREPVTSELPRSAAAATPATAPAHLRGRRSRDRLRIDLPLPQGRAVGGRPPDLRRLAASADRHHPHHLGLGEPSRRRSTTCRQRRLGHADLPEHGRAPGTTSRPTAWRPARCAAVSSTRSSTASSPPSSPPGRRRRTAVAALRRRDQPADPHVPPLADAVHQGVHAARDRGVRRRRTCR